ncbi:MAG TPA: Tex family protein [Negativicutes bacterium]|nr:Tex family protein [Negativicutes bacterium]
MDIVAKLAKELSVKLWQVENTVKLIDDGNTIPFIARYRKELTGELSDTILRDLSERLTYLRNLESRKEEVIRLIEEQGKLTEELRASIDKAEVLQEVEDLYRPYKQKKRTRATIAREKGLEPLANIIWLQQKNRSTLEDIAAGYINTELGVDTVQDALNGASDIIAEIISDNAEFRKEIRELTYKNGNIAAKGTKEEKSEYQMYYDFSEPVFKIAPHRILAVNRGEKEEFLSVKVEAPVEKILAYIGSNIILENSPYRELLGNVIKDSYSRLIAPSIEREIRGELTDMAEEQAIKVFAANLRNLLLQAPIKGKTVMGFDPAFRTGCKIAVVDDTGKLLETATVYLTLSENQLIEGKKVLQNLIRKYNVEVISLGNGTASRESEKTCAEIIKEMDLPLHYVIVNEAGASVYSASELAAQEYPDINVSLRGAISIARRLQDPLAELVKIDPKSIGVGQYQHDVTQKKLSESLGGVVEDCVNSVGVDLNTASPSLLQHISGVNSGIAKNIVAYREENGKFTKRRELLKVKKLGEKAFEQAAGFLRIPESENILDNTSVHPESYEVAEKLLKKAGYTLKGLKQAELAKAVNQLAAMDVNELAAELSVGVPTLRDILNELRKPGRDPRDEMPKPVLMSDVLDIKDLRPEMILTGTVRNVIDFGAFVDIGVHQDGLVHISELADRFVKRPLDVVQVGDIVKVKVLSVDLDRNRISLSMKGLN